MCYRQYVRDRERIWTSITLNALAARKLDILEGPVSCVQVCYQDWISDDELLRRTLQASYRQINEGVPIRLDIQGCRILLRITDSIWWKVDALSEKRDKVYCSRPFFDEKGSQGRPYYSRFSVLADSSNEVLTSELGTCYETFGRRRYSGGIGTFDKEEKKILYPQGKKNYHTIDFGDELGAQVFDYVPMPHLARLESKNYWTSWLNKDRVVDGRYLNSDRFGR